MALRSEPGEVLDGEQRLALGSDEEAEAIAAFDLGIDLTEV